MGDLIESLRVGAFTYSTPPFKRTSSRVDLWAEADANRNELMLIGAMKMQGRFRGEWTAQIDLGNEILRFEGNKYEGFHDSGVYGRCPFQVSLRFLKKPELQISIANEKWSAIYPRTLYTDGPRPSDRSITFCGNDRSFELWIFPAEFYDSSRLLPSTRRIVDQVESNKDANNLLLLKTLIATSLIGYSFWR